MKKTTETAMISEKSNQRILVFLLFFHCPLEDGLFQFS